MNTTMIVPLRTFILAPQSMENCSDNSALDTNDAGKPTKFWKQKWMELNKHIKDHHGKQDPIPIDPLACPLNLVEYCKSVFQLYATLDKSSCTYGSHMQVSKVWYQLEANIKWLLLSHEQEEMVQVQVGPFGLTKQITKQKKLFGICWATANNGPKAFVTNEGE